MVPSSSMRMGTRNPKALMLCAICSSCFFGCVLAFRAFGLSVAIAIICMVAMSRLLSAEAKRMRIGRRLFQTKLFRVSGSDHYHADRIAHLQGRVLPI